MAVLKMDKIEIYGLNEYRKPILEYLHRLEIMEFSNVSDEELSHKNTIQYISQFDSYIASAGRAISILETYGGEKKKLFSKRRILGEDAYSMDKDEINRTDKYIRRILKNQDLIEEHEENIGKITAKQQLLAPYEALDVPMRFSETKTTFARVGTVEGEWSREKINLAFSNVDCHIEIISSNGQKTYLWILFPKQCEEKINDIFRKIGFVEPSFSLSHHMPKEKIRVLEEAKKSLTAEIELFKEDLQKCFEYAEDIKLYYDHLVMRREKYEALSKVGLTKNTFVMRGYIPQKYTKELEKNLFERYGAYLDVVVSDDAEAPKIFSNGAFASPVEGITSDYSMPSAHDIDPNPIMAIFYYLFFGMMFSDAGYGILMVIVCGILGFGKILEKKSRKKFKMFFFCGVSTTFWGLMYGSFFGDMIPTVSKTFGSGGLTFTPLLMDPVAKPMELLILSVSFGMIHILTALFIRFYMLWRQKKRFDAIFDVGFWILVLLGISLAVAGAAIGGGIVLKIGIVGIAAGAVGLIFTQGRDKKNIFMKFFGGLLSLYDITSYIGDILSYSRLMALGLATGVIASVVNILGSLTGNVFMFIAISIFGHALNFAINMLGAYVHTNRLQYVEFYQKFYEGGGKKFNPLSMKTKYFNFSQDK